MTFVITKEFHFSAAHQLKGLPEEHPCARLHGHNYIVKVELMSEEVDAVGFVLDYGELDHVKHNIDVMLDHRFLNDIFPDINPTAENLAAWLWHRINEGHAGDKMREIHEEWGLTVYISETPKTWASYDGLSL